MISSVGRGTLPASALAELLTGAGVAHVVDIRSFPASRRNPQYHRDQLERWLAEVGITYSVGPTAGRPKVCGGAVIGAFSLTRLSSSAVHTERPECPVVSPIGTAGAYRAQQERGLFDHGLRKGDAAMPALPVPVAAAVRRAPSDGTYPELGEHGELPGATT